MTYPNNGLKYQTAPALHKLLADFGRKMRQIHRLSMKIGHLSARRGTKPTLWIKLDQWVMQLSGLKNKEQATLSRIKAIEVQHQKMRRKKQLKMAHTFDDRFGPAQPTPSARNKNRALWIWLIAFYMTMLRPKKSVAQKTLTNG